MDLSQKKPIGAILSLKNTKEQGVFLKRLGTLLREGYSIKDGLHFLSKIGIGERKRWAEQISMGLEKGHLFHEELMALHFPDKVCSQVYFASIHGRFSETVYLSGEQLLVQTKKQKKFLQLIHYPFLLIVFMVGMLFSMRFILLPHITRLSGDVTTSMGWIEKGVIGFVYTAPYWFSGLLLLALIILIVTYFMLKEKSQIEKITFYSQLPSIGKYIQLYWTQFFTLEWSYLLKAGCNMKEIIYIMQAKDASLLLQEVSFQIETAMHKGREFNETVGQYGFLKKEIVEIIIHGERSGNLSAELLIYSLECEEELSMRIEKMMERIQPLVFVGVALMIIIIYAALLLPTFNLMEGL